MESVRARTSPGANPASSGVGDDANQSRVVRGPLNVSALSGDAAAALSSRVDSLREETANHLILQKIFPKMLSRVYMVAIQYRCFLWPENIP